MGVLEREHFAARGQNVPGIARRQHFQQGNAVEGRYRAANRRGDSVALEVMHQQIGGGGQIRQDSLSLGGRALAQPLADRLAADAEAAWRGDLSLKDTA